MKKETKENSIKRNLKKCFDNVNNSNINVYSRTICKYCKEY